MSDPLKKLGANVIVPPSIGVEDALTSVSGAEQRVRTRESIEIRVDASLINPPNSRLELAFEVRALLKKGATGPLAEALAKGGAINEPLLALIDRWFPNVLKVDPLEAAKKIRTLPPAELEALLAAPLTARPDEVLAAAQKNKKAAAIVDRGRAILTKLALSTDEKERAFLSQLRCSSASIGRLAEALDAKTPAAFLAKIRGASEARIAEMLNFVETDRVFRKAMQADVLKDSWSLDQVIDRSAVLVGGSRTAVEEDFARAKRALLDAGVPEAEKWLYAGAHVTDGGTTHSRDLPFSAMDRVPYAIEQALEAKVRALGLTFAHKSFGIRALDALFETRDSPRAAALFASTVFEFCAGPRGPNETRTQYLQRLLRDVSVDDARAVLLRDYQADSPAMLAELGEMKSMLVEIEATEREAEHAIALLRRELDAGVLPLPIAAKRAIEKHMLATNPKEGCGYLVSDGAAMFFYPIKNVAKSVGYHAVQDQEDLERVNTFLRSSGWFVLGQVHSHPGMRALPSSGDFDEMRPSVALAPGRRMIIAGIDAATKAIELCSFESGIDGQVIREDRIDVLR